MASEYNTDYDEIISLKVHQNVMNVAIMKRELVPYRLWLQLLQTKCIHAIVTCLKFMQMISTVLCSAYHCLFNE